MFNTNSPLLLKEGWPKAGVVDYSLFLKFIIEKPDPKIFFSLILWITAYSNL